MKTLVLHLADWHYGKETSKLKPESNKIIIQNLSNAIREESVKCDELVVIAGGDINDGTQIYATQTHHQWQSNVEEQAMGWSSMVAEFLKDMASLFSLVRFYGVPGNHGRGGNFAHEGANWDKVAYRFLQLQLANHERIKAEVQDWEQLTWFRQIEIRGHSFLVYHGHCIRMYQKIPWYGITQHALLWKQAIPGWDVLLLGHFHSLGFLTGSPAIGDEWAIQRLGKDAEPFWWLITVSDDDPIQDLRMVRLL